MENASSMRKEVRNMSEEQKKQAEEIMEATNKLNDQSREIVIAYIRGMADAARVMQIKGQDEN